LANPKRKTSKSRKNKRRTHWIEKEITLVECSRCHEYKLPHHVCPSCGYYNGEKIIPEKKTKEAKAS
jgi:large subunit ribosomal protein L32